ncbi:hypothetical protein GH714_040520 [Hevea brasiliensis]|uniref:Uncharacterized protein n=1 Tax=Hevea brasiliensis TaxID=3981 RepID=A0A6A6MGI7_HEVBR|nr:hypothetical protein GH714_040520 [Hevea brasiliensis]
MTTSQSDHATHEATNIGDDDSLRDIPSLTSPKIPAISAPAPMTSSIPSSSAISSQRAAPLVDVVNLLQDLDFYILAQFYGRSNAHLATRPFDITFIAAKN